MGGLVAREFVSRWRHPAAGTPLVEGPAVSGAILVGTPNHGSEWARLRVWLELRDQFPTANGRRFSLFAALRDGTGEAKLDLRPGSDFLRELNARPWPRSVRILTVAGQVLDRTPGLGAGFEARLEAGLDAASAECDSSALRQRLEAWWSGIGAGLGDGVVTLDSVRLPDAPPPLVVNASHRGMLARVLPGDPEPPAIAPILDALRDWASHGTAAPLPGI
jgi:hypothetical protein